MCRRYYRTADARALAEAFEAEPTGDEAAYAPAYNIAPRSTQLVIREARETAIREIVPMRWGLIGYKTSGPDPALKTHNARAENLKSSDLWRAPLHKLDTKNRVKRSASPFSIQPFSRLQVCGMHGKTLQPASGFKATRS